MASYAVSSSQVAAHDKTLVASTVDTVTFDGDPDYVEVMSDGASAIYFTTDGTAPTVSGQNGYIVPAYPSARVVRHGGEGGIVKLISSGTPTYSVTRS